MNDQYYTAYEAQAKLGLSKAMFFRKVKEGVIPKVVQPGMKQGNYPRRDIDALAMSMNVVFEHYDKLIFSRSTPADQVEEMRIAIRCFGRDFITPLAERMAFQQKSEFTFYSLKAEGRVVGYISMFRFPESFLDDLLTGRRIDNEITIREVLPFVRLKPFSVYIDVLAIDPDLPPQLQYVYENTIISRFVEMVLNLLAHGYQVSRLYRITVSMEGDHLVRKVGFRQMEGKSIDPSRTAFEYLLDDEGIQHLRVLNSKRD